MTGFQKLKKAERELRAVARRAGHRGQLKALIQVSGYGPHGREHCGWWSDEWRGLKKSDVTGMLRSLSFSHPAHEDFEYRLVIITAIHPDEIASTGITEEIHLINVEG